MPSRQECSKQIVECMQAACADESCKASLAAVLVLADSINQRVRMLVLLRSASPASAAFCCAAVAGGSCPCSRRRKSDERWSAHQARAMGRGALPLRCASPLGASDAGSMHPVHPKRDMQPQFGPLGAGTRPITLGGNVLLRSRTGDARWLACPSARPSERAFVSC